MVVLGPDGVLGTRRLGEQKVDPCCSPAPIRQPASPRPATSSSRSFPARGHSRYSRLRDSRVRILRIPAAEAEQFTPAVLAALLFADGSGTRAAGAIRAGRSLEDQRVIMLPPDQVRSLDRLLGEIDACTR